MDLARAPRRRPDLRAHHDQDHAGAGMGDVASSRRSRPRRRRRRSACRPAISSVPTRPSSPRRNRCSRATERCAEGRLRRSIRQMKPVEARWLTAVFSTGRSSRTATGRWPTSWTPGRRQPAGRRMATSMRPAADLVAALGRGGWLRPIAAATGGRARSTCAALCLIRETLARHDGLADFAFAMQGLGTGAISLFGTPEQQADMAAEDARRDRRSPPLR